MRSNRTKEAIHTHTNRAVSAINEPHSWLNQPYSMEMVSSMTSRYFTSMWALIKKKLQRDETKPEIEATRSVWETWLIWYISTNVIIFTASLNKLQSIHMCWIRCVAAMHKWIRLLFFFHPLVSASVPGCQTSFCTLQTSIKISVVSNIRRSFYFSWYHSIEKEHFSLRLAAKMKRMGLCGSHYLQIKKMNLLHREQDAKKWMGKSKK